MRAFNDVGGRIYQKGKVPTESDGSHWRSDVFQDEVMLPSALTWDARQPISIITIQALADLGYTVDPTKADPFKITGMSKRAVPGQPVWRCGVEVK